MAIDVQSFDVHRHRSNVCELKQSIRATVLFSDADGVSPWFRSASFGAFFLTGTPVPYLSPPSFYLAVLHPPVSDLLRLLSAIQPKVQGKCRFVFQQFGVSHLSEWDLPKNFEPTHLDCGTVHAEKSASNQVPKKIRQLVHQKHEEQVQKQV